MGNGRSLAFNGHLDTVPPYNMNQDYFSAPVIGNRIYGRGSVDMKGPIAAMVYGPGDISRSHTPEEYITVEELLEGFKVYLMLAARYCYLA